jgi:hypothetical protein
MVIPVKLTGLTSVKSQGTVGTAHPAGLDSPAATPRPGAAQAGGDEMTMNSGPMWESAESPFDRVLQLALDYGQACFEHGAAKARYEAQRARTASADDTAVRDAGMAVTKAYAAFRLALPMPLLVPGREPGE